MAHLWRKETSGWTPLTLGAAAFSLARGADAGVDAAAAVDAPAAALNDAAEPGAGASARRELATGDPPALDLRALGVPPLSVPSPDLPAPKLPAADLPAPKLPAADLPAPDFPTPDLPSRDFLPLNLPAPDFPALLRCPAGTPDSAAGSLHSGAETFDAVWVLVTSPGDDVAVNGRPVRTGLVALRDRDEIRLASGERLFFSTQEIAAVEPFGGAPVPLRCPRCRRVLEPGSPVVRCPGPGCGVVHHQSDELPCWTYAERCALCPEPTELGGDHRWTPEGL